MARLSNWRIFVIISSAVALLSNAYSFMTSMEQASVISAIKSDYESLGDISYETNARIETSDSAYLMAGVLFIATSIAVFLAIIGWTHANSKLAHEAQPENMRHSTGWAVGAWFVPFLNLVRPKQIIDDSLKINSPNFSTGLVPTWWALLLISNISSNIASRWTNASIAKFDGVSNWSEYVKVVNEVVSAYNFESGSYILGVIFSAFTIYFVKEAHPCLLYTSDAADE